MEMLFSERNQKISIQESYAHCATLATEHYENFSVGSLLIPKDKRKHLYAIYAFCRFVDDLGDEYNGDRLQALDAYEQDLILCYDDTPSYPYMVALQETIRTFDIPIEPFTKLIQANRMDQTQTRYETYEKLKLYCDHSANPVGHMVLYLCGYRDQERQGLSNDICTALQLVNFWQDVTRDFNKGRIYIPTEDMYRFGYSEALIEQRLCTPEFRNLMAFEVDRTRELFDEGTRLLQTLKGRTKSFVALFRSGGLKILDAIEEQEYDVLNKRPALSQNTKLRLMLNSVIKLGLGFKQ